MGKSKIDSLLNRCDVLSKSAGFLTLIIGLLIITQPVFKLNLHYLSPFLTPIQLIIGLSFILLGLSLIFLYKVKIHPQLIVLHIIFMTVVFLTALLLLSDEIMEAGLDFFKLVSPQKIDTNNSILLTMPPIIAINFLFASCALIALNNPKDKYIWIKHLFALLIFIIASICLLEHLYFVSLHDRFVNFIDTFLVINITFIVLSIGIFFSYPEYGITRIFLLDSASSKLAWRLLPMALLLPPLLDALSIGGVTLGLYDREYRSILVCGVFMGIFVALSLFVVYYLDNIENRNTAISGQLAYLKDSNLRKNSQIMMVIATHDSLTGLANRNYFHILLEHAIKRARRNNSIVGVLYINIDHFKKINNEFPHITGDEILKEMGERLKKSLRDVDIIARLSGDEFSVILENPLDIASIRSIVNRLSNVLNIPFSISNQEIQITVSIGVSSYPTDGKDVQTLISNASIAVERMRKLGGNGIQFYNQQDNFPIKN